MRPRGVASAAYGQNKEKKKEIFLSPLEQKVVWPVMNGAAAGTFHSNWILARNMEYILLSIVINTISFQVLQ